MFIDFFYFLRSRGLKISIGEWIVLLEGLQKGLHGSTLGGFYQRPARLHSGRLLPAVQGGPDAGRIGI